LILGNSMWVPYAFDVDGQIIRVFDGVNHEVDEDYIPRVEDALLFYENSRSRKVIEEAFTQALKHGRSYDYQLKIITAKGNKKWVRTWGKPVMNKGECRYIAGTIQDITKQKNNELELKQQKNRLKKRKKEIMPEDVATLIYTTGTTGKPKGAMLTQRNIVSNVKSAHEAISIGETDRCLSFLPLCHSFERTGGYYAMMAGGAEIYYSESVDTVARNMLEAKPTIVVSVPRLFEKIYNLVTKNVEEGSAIQQSIFNWSLAVGEKYWHGKRGFVSIQKVIADKLVFSKLRERTGGNIRFFVSGGAALPAEIGTFFMSAGLNILEGYGLTETSPVMCCNRYGDERMGTVGKVINGVTVGIQRLDDNKIVAQLSGEDYPSDLTSEAGEILNRGPNTMKGYWKNEEATKEMIDEDGWLHTGDVGRFVDGRLQITDRRSF